MKLTAAMAMPTPKRTPASTRFDPPSPKAKVRPDTTIATRERPRAIVLVNACCRTLTAFYHGEAPWAKAGAANNRTTAATVNCRNTLLNRRALLQSGLICWYLLCRFLRRSISLGEFSPELLLPGDTSTRQAEPGPCFNLLGNCQGTLGALAPCSGFLPSRPARRPSAVRDAWRATRLNQVHQAPRGTFGENSPLIPREHREGKK